MTINKKQLAILARGAERAAVNLATEGRMALAAEATEFAEAATKEAGKRAVAWNDRESLPFCVCGRRLSECDGSRAGCRRVRP